MNAVIIFDIEPKERLSELRKALKENGFYKGWSIEGKKYFLPENCMWKPDSELYLAKNDVINTVAKINNGATNNLMVLRRCMVFSNMPWDGIEGFDTGLEY